MQRESEDRWQRERERENIPQKWKGSPLFDWWHPTSQPGHRCQCTHTGHSLRVIPDVFQATAVFPQGETSKPSTWLLHLLRSLRRLMDSDNLPRATVTTTRANQRESLSPTCPFDRSDSVSQEPANWSRSHHHGVDGEKISRELPWAGVFDDLTSPVES